MEKIIDFFNKFKAGEFGYGALKNSVVKFDSAVAKHPDMANFMNLFNSLASILPYIMIAVMFLFIFWGKKLLTVVKFVSSFAVGFGLGVYFVSDIVNFLPAWVSGVVIGILAAIIYRFLYVIFFAVAGFYTVFTLCNALLGNLLASLGEVKSLAFLGIAAVGMLLMFIFRKYVEMFGKSGDTKPVTGIVTGSKFTEVNTGDVYLFDETSDGTWTKVAAGWTDPDA